ncbi:MAG: metal-dependent transcriptional regulator [Candidatus Bathyarchaeota archaeon]|jgi:DtxR family Mn-dependent transcriptional regulator|nr:metal-dependent transcriptional regulator [Candidatus Bathyarchaeota archaeon]
MNLSESSEEILESLWISSIEGGEATSNFYNMEKETKDKAIRELKTLKLISTSENQILLTKKGQNEAENVVRRHRLAERLLVDILDTEIGLVEEAACKLEHAIRRGIDDNVCILLGHPRVCPHGKSIPKGRCCRKGSTKTTKVVVPLSQMKPDQEGRIAYIHSKGRGRLQKLMAMGITPGMNIRIIQRFPSHVFQIERAQIAVDEEIAKEIFVVAKSS